MKTKTVILFPPCTPQLTYDGATDLVETPGKVIDFLNKRGKRVTSNLPYVIVEEEQATVVTQA